MYVSTKINRKIGVYIYIHLHFVVSCVKYTFNLIDHITLISFMLLQPFNLFLKKMTWGPCRDTKTLAIVH